MFRLVELIYLDESTSRNKFFFKGDEKPVFFIYNLVFILVGELNTTKKIVTINHNLLHQLFTSSHPRLLLRRC